MTHRLRRRAVLALPALAGLAAPARAQAPAWPQRPVRLIVPFTPGSTVDLAGRVVAPHLSTALGQPVPVENRTGAGGLIGVDAVAKATDGHTVGVATNGPVALARQLFRNLPYDPQRDLALISLLVRAPQILVVNPRVEAQDAPGLIRLARSRPRGALTYGTVGAGASGHLAMEALMAGAGIALEHVVYRGFPEVVLDLVAGRIDAAFAVTAAVLEQIRDGRVRALGVSASRRFHLTPDVPTLAEQGVELISYSWTGLIGPATLPGPAVARMAEAARAGMADPQARAVLERAGFEVVGSTPEEFRAVAAAESREWGGLIERLGIRLEG